MKTLKSFSQHTAIYAAFATITACGGGGGPNNDSSARTLEFTSTATSSIQENAQTAAYVPTTSIRGANISLVEGQDSALFTIGEDGAVYFISPPDFETPRDTDTNNRYQFNVSASVGSRDPITQAVTITVTNANAVADARIHFPSPGANLGGLQDTITVTGALYDSTDTRTGETADRLEINGSPVTIDPLDSSQWLASVPISQNNASDIQLTFVKADGSTSEQTITVFNEFTPNYDELALDEINNRAFFIDQTQDAVYETNLTNGEVSLVSGKAKGSGDPLVQLTSGIVYSPEHGLVVHDSFWDGIILIDPITGDRRLISATPTRSDDIGSGPSINNISDLQLRDDGSTVQLLTFGASQQLIEVDLNTGNRSETLASFGNRFNFVSDGNVAYALDNISNAPSIDVLKFDLSTQESTVVSSLDRGTGPQIVSAFDLALDKARNQLLISSTLNTIYRVDLSTGDRSATTIPPAAADVSQNIGALAAGINDSAYAYHIGMNQLLNIDLNSGDATPVTESNQNNIGPSHLSIQQLFHDATNERLIIANNRAILSISQNGSPNRNNITPANAFDDGAPTSFTDTVFDNNNQRLYRLSGDRNQIWVTELSNTAQGSDYQPLNSPEQDAVFSAEAPSSTGMATLMHRFIDITESEQTQAATPILSLQLDTKHQRILALTNRGVLAFDTNTGAVSAVFAFSNENTSLTAATQWLNLGDTWLIFDRDNTMSFSQENFSLQPLNTRLANIPTFGFVNLAFIGTPNKLLAIYGTRVSTLQTDLDPTPVLQDDGSTDSVVAFDLESFSQTPLSTGDTATGNIPLEQIRATALDPSRNLLYVAEGRSIIAINLNTGERSIVSR